MGGQRVAGELKPDLVIPLKHGPGSSGATEWGRGGGTRGRGSAPSLVNSLRAAPGRATGWLSSHERTHLQPHNLLRLGLSAVPTVGGQERVAGACGARRDFHGCWCVSVCVWGEGAHCGHAAGWGACRAGALPAETPGPSPGGPGLPPPHPLSEVPHLPGSTGPSTEIKFRASAPWFRAPTQTMSVTLGALSPL